MKIIFEDVVKLMERGQLTLPKQVRKMLNIGPESLISVKVLSNKDVLINPLKPRQKSMADFLKKMAKDKHIYWTDEDEKARLENRMRSTERIKKLWNENTS